MILYHRTHEVDAILDRGFRDGAEHLSNGGEMRRGVWLADAPLDGIAGDPTMRLLALEVPDHVARMHRLEPPPGQGYHEYVIPAEVLNGLGRPRALPPDEILHLAQAFAPLPPDAGVVGLLSSDEFTEETEPFALRLLEATGGHVAVVLAASPGDIGSQTGSARAHYGRLGADADTVPVLRREEARAEALPECDLVFLAGGDPSVLLKTLGGTPLWEEIVRRWREGRALAGSSAGAMALCEQCLLPVPGASEPTVWSRGLGLIRGAGLAVHAATRSQEWLEEVRRTAPLPVVALDDRTGVLLRAGATPEIVGDGRIRVLPAGVPGA